MYAIIESGGKHYRIEEGDVILTEFDASYLGYTGQYNQSFSVGEPNKEWQEILTLMKNRMSFGGYRYGPTQKQKRRAYDNIADMHRRLDLHDKTGNMEHLVDNANISIIACLKKDHPNFHFESIDDGGHAKKRGT